MPKLGTTLVTALCLGLGAAQGAGLTLSSPDFVPGGTLKLTQVLGAYGCTGSNVSPALNWKGAPAGTKSYALTVFDPDAESGKGWWHWVVYNLPASASGLKAGAGDPAQKRLPAGAVQGPTDFGEPGYGGPCPPAGDKPHRYIFTLYALKVARLTVPADASAAEVDALLRRSQLAKTTLTGYYGR